MTLERCAFSSQRARPPKNEVEVINVAKRNLGKVNLETCWPAVYHGGRPTGSQGPLAAHVLAVPALPFSRMIADQSQLLLPPPLPVVSMFLAALHWFFSMTGAWCWVVTGSPWIPPRWVGTAFGGPSITRHPSPRSSVDEFVMKIKNRCRHTESHVNHTTTSILLELTSNYHRVAAPFSRREWVNSDLWWF